MSDKKSAQREYTKAIISGLVSGIIIYFGIQSTLSIKESGWNLISIVIYLGIGVLLAIGAALVLWPVYWRVCRK